MRGIIFYVLSVIAIFCIFGGASLLDSTGIWEVIGFGVSILGGLILIFVARFFEDVYR